MTANWDEVFGDLDVRTLSCRGRLNFVDREIEATLNGREWAAFGAGEEGNLAWEAAVQSFVGGNWVASILCCHVVCEREVAGILSLSRPRLEDSLHANWESFGLGRLLDEAQRLELLPPDLAVSVRELCDARKPYGHWRTAFHPQTLMRRVRAEYELTGHEDWENLRERLVVRDATAAMRTTISLYFGSYVVGK